MHHVMRHVDFFRRVSRSDIPGSLTSQTNFIVNKSLDTMRWKTWLAFLLLPAALVSASEAPTELVVERTLIPDDCVLSAESGDFVKVHYVCYFLE